MVEKKEVEGLFSSSGSLIGRIPDGEYEVRIPSVPSQIAFVKKRRRDKSDYDTINAGTLKCIRPKGSWVGIKLVREEEKEWKLVLVHFSSSNRYLYHLTFDLDVLNPLLGITKGLVRTSKDLVLLLYNKNIPSKDLNTLSKWRKDLLYAVLNVCISTPKTDICRHLFSMPEFYESYLHNVNLAGVPVLTKEKFQERISYYNSKFPIFTTGKGRCAKWEIRESFKSLFDKKE